MAKTGIASRKSSALRRRENWRRRHQRSGGARNSWRGAAIGGGWRLSAGVSASGIGESVSEMASETRSAHQRQSGISAKASMAASGGEKLSWHHHRIKQRCWHQRHQYLCWQRLALHAAASASAALSLALPALRVAGAWRFLAAICSLASSKLCWRIGRHHRHLCFIRLSAFPYHLFPGSWRHS
jgi:hypothetical protein